MSEAETTLTVNQGLIAKPFLEKLQSLIKNTNVSRSPSLFSGTYKPNLDHPLL